LGHKLLSFDKILKDFFENKGNKIIEDKNIFMLYVIYYYQSPFLPKFKFFELLKRIPFSNGEFKFYGQLVNRNENIFLKNIISNNKNKEGKWHKGIMINKNNKLIIHGYFYIFLKDKKINLFPKIFGLLSYNDEIKFFGFTKINKDIINNEEKLDIKDFIFEYGLLYDKQYYFGEFNQDSNNDVEIDIKKIIKGEIFYIKENGIEVKRVQKLNTPSINIDKNYNFDKNYNRYDVKENYTTINPHIPNKDNNNNFEKNYIIDKIKEDYTIIIKKYSKEEEKCEEFISITPFKKFLKKIIKNAF
jgi:hypothetical protein